MTVNVSTELNTQTETNAGKEIKVTAQTENKTKLVKAYEGAKKQATTQLKLEKSAREAQRMALGYLAIMLIEAGKSDDDKISFRSLVKTNVEKIVGTKAIDKIMSKDSEEAKLDDCKVAIKLGWGHLESADFKNLTKFAKVLYELVYGPEKATQLDNCKQVVDEIAKRGGTEAMIKAFTKRKKTNSSNGAKQEAQLAFGETALQAAYSYKQSTKVNATTDGLGICVVRYTDGKMKIVGEIDNSAEAAKEYVLNACKNPPNAFSTCNWLADIMQALKLYGNSDELYVVIESDTTTTKVKVAKIDKMTSVFTTLNYNKITGLPEGKFCISAKKLKSMHSVAQCLPNAKLEVSENRLTLALLKGTLDKAFDAYSETREKDFELPDDLIKSDKSVSCKFDSTEEKSMPAFSDASKWNKQHIWLEKNDISEMAAGCKMLENEFCSIAFKKDAFVVKETRGTGPDAKIEERFKLNLKVEQLEKHTNMQLPMFTRDVKTIAQILHGCGNAPDIYFSADAIKLEFKRNNVDWTIFIPARSADNVYELSKNVTLKAA